MKESHLTLVESKDGRVFFAGMMRGTGEIKVVARV